MNPELYYKALNVKVMAAHHTILWVRATRTERGYMRLSVSRDEQRLMDRILIIQRLLATVTFN